MKKTINTLGILLICFPALMAQTDQGWDQLQQPDRRLGIGFGYQNRLLLDEQKSALVYRSSEWMGSISYESERVRSWYRLRAAAATGDFHARDHDARWIYTTNWQEDGNAVRDSFPLASGILSAQLSFDYLRQLNAGTRWKWYCGLSMNEYLLYPENNIGLLNALSVAISARLALHLGRHYFDGDLSSPFLSLNSRLPWHNTVTDPVMGETKSFFKKGTRLVTANRFQSVRTNLGYSFKTGNRFMLGFAYSWNWYHVSYHQPMQSTVHSLQFKTIILL